jgi:uncharacterized membrane protein
MTVPVWALSLSYWLHMLATVLWLGGLASFHLFLFPALRQIADPAARLQLFERAQKRLDPLGWFCLLLLTATGLVQMSASPAYAGFLSISNPWAATLLLKHIVFLGMAGVSAYTTWGALPGLRRALLRHSLGQPAEADDLLRQHARLLRLNLLLGVIVLTFTALARVST